MLQSKPGSLAEPRSWMAAVLAVGHFRGEIPVVFFISRGQLKARLAQVLDLEEERGAVQSCPAPTL